ncbi:MAG: beta-ketoacyl-[acyl-carrier-protein] synthase family protein [Proteobacteria bacterium]|nr:beta-ketoacyl-[acyl-carrier-protein] synthase family protein [Pseudomonadota bacterium]
MSLAGRAEQAGGSRVVVTGLGAVTALGLDFDTSFAALLAGRSGVGPAPAAVLAATGGAIAAAVPDDFATRVPRAEVSFDRATQLGLAAAREAIVDAGLTDTAVDRGRVGIYAGIGMGGAQIVEATMRDLAARSLLGKPGAPASVHPLTVPRMMPNALCAWLSIEHGFRGPTCTYSVACASSAVAIGEALRCIRHGYADAIVVVGAEALLSAGSFAAWNALRVLAAPDAEAVAASHKPFDARRSGFVLGEGSAALVLESAGHARRRGRSAYAGVAGYGTSTDAHHITQPSRSGQAAAMDLALHDSGLQPTEVGYLNAHGTATPVGDVVETQAIHDAFGAHARRLAVSSTKSMHGHLIGAGGALEFAISVKALATGSIPPTAHLTQPDPACDLDFVPVAARHGQRLVAVMSNSFAFGGSNAALLATHAER